LGSTEVEEARRLIDICFEAGVNLFDTADGYSDGRSEEILGKALAGKRDKALISTKAGFRRGRAER
jgi:aryl-alcohol dehydrogenase-like predicted oxidoreductase